MEASIAPEDLSHLNVTGKVHISEANVASGGYSNISRGLLTCQTGETKEVAVKTFRIRGHTDSSSSVERLCRRLRHEKNIWHRLEHPNIVPFLGFSIPLNAPPSLVSPWFENGNVTKYLGSHPQADRKQIIYHLSCGLAYLHSIGIVHGDIKAENALIDANGIASWCDFGLSHFLEDLPGRSGNTPSSTLRDGTIPFLSPEQVVYGHQHRRKTTMMDMWSFGCLIAQVMGDQPLYSGCRNDLDVIREIFRGSIPVDTVKQVALHPQQKPVWVVVDRCWRKNPGARPTAADVLGEISKLLDASQVLVHSNMRYDVHFDTDSVCQNDLSPRALPRKPTSQFLLFFLLPPSRVNFLVRVGLAPRRF